MALLCLTVAVAQGEPANPRTPTPGLDPPRAEQAVKPIDNKAQKIFLFTDTSARKKKKPNSSTEYAPSPSQWENPATVAANKQDSIQIFLFTDTPVEKEKETGSAIAHSKQKPLPSSSLNPETQKIDSDWIDEEPATQPAMEQTNPEKTSDFYFSDAPPEGFEFLTAAQTTEVDIYFGNELLTSTMAHFDLTSIEFINPQEIIAQLTQLKEPEAITSAITGSLNPHTEDLCLNKLQRNCGVLKPSIAEIIFDANRYRVDLFINPLYLTTQTPHSQIFLPAPENSLSSINILSARSSGGNGLEQRAYLVANSLVSYGATRFLSRIQMDNDDGLIFENASLEHDRGKWTYTAGTMESTSYVSSLAKTHGFLGLRAARTLNTRTDLRLSNASRIFVFFNQRSYVEILKDGKVLDSGFYEYGNQQIDTSQLPEGVYNITLRITNNRGEELQTHLFSRTSVLPPQDHALHFLEAGMLLEKNEIGDINNAPKTSNVSFIHTGSRLRLTDRFGADFEALNTSEDTALVQAGLYYFLPGLYLHGGALGASEHTQGRFLDMNFSHRLFSLSLFFRNLETNQTETDSPFQAGTRTGLTFGARILGGSLFAHATNSRNADLPTDTEYSLDYRRALFRRGSTLAYLTLNWKSGQDDDTVAMGLQITGSDNTHQKSLATRWTDSGHDSTLQTEGRFTRFHRHNGELFGSTTLTAQADKDQQTIGLHLKGDSRYGNGFIKTQHQRYAESNSDNTTYSAGVQAVVITGASAIALGGSKPGRAGVIVDLNGQSKEDFEVRINNQKRAIATHSRKQPVLLPPYRSYDVTLKPKGDSLVRFDAKPQTVTLYPGNVAHLQWDVDPVFVVTGQAVYANGKPVENTQITNLEEFSGTDENGWFQVELSKMKTLELAPTDGPACNIKLPEQSVYEEVVVLDQLVCDSTIQSTSNLQ